MGKDPLKQKTRHYTGLWMTIVVVAFVLGWRLLVVAKERASHWRDIADELGSLPQFAQDLSPNSAGTRLIYCQTTEKGVGIYYYNIDSGQSKLLCEQDEKGYSWQRYCMLGWSPDDKLFAYALPLKTHPADQPWMRDEQIVICDGTTGETVTNLPADPGLYELAWLSPHSFVYSTDFNYSLRRLEQKTDGTWVVRQVYNPTTNKMETLTAISEDSVAWQEAGDVWTLNFESGAIKKIWDSVTNQVQLVDFTYSMNTGEFLLNCYDAKGQFLIRFSPVDGAIYDAGRIGSQPDFVSIVQDINNRPQDWVAGWKRQGLIIVNARRVDDGSQYAYESYLSEMGNWPALFVKSPVETAPIQVPWSGFVDDFAMGGSSLFFIGSESGKIPGIWEFNFKSRACRCLVGGSAPVGYTRISVPRTGLVTNESGDVKTYFLWPPVTVAEGKQYPLIITKQFWNWFSYDQIAANEGYYFAIVDQSCELALVRMLASSPGIDASRVYLYESSAGTADANELISEYPSLWRGAILFGAFSGPDLPDLAGKRLLIVDGADDGNGVEVKSLASYQAGASQAGVPVTVALLKDSGHMPNAISSERTRAGHFAEFLSKK